MRYCLEIAYDGTAYSGWQIQPNANTVQAELELALGKVLNENTSVMGCGRTDAGVHATQFFLHFDFSHALPSKFLFRLNQVLPRDIAGLSISEKHDKFHARFDAVKRGYIYKAHTEKDPFLNNRSWFMYQSPELKAMNDCCKVLLETKDFASFCKSGADNKTTICHLTEAKWVVEGHQYLFHISADRFLRNMVRAIVGTMIEVGNGNRSLDDFIAAVEAKDRRRSGKSAAANGLYLNKVEY